MTCGSTRKPLLSILLLGTSSTIFGQSLDQKLKQDCATCDSDKRTTLEQLVELAQRFQLPMGIEWVDTPDETTVKPIHLQNVSVKEVISHILNEQAGYRFRPSGTTGNKIWVPLRQVSWVWQASATFNGSAWTIASHSDPTNLSDADSTAHPQWTTNADTGH